MWSRLVLQYVYVASMAQSSTEWVMLKPRSMLDRVTCVLYRNYYKIKVRKWNSSWSSAPASVYVLVSDIASLFCFQSTTSALMDGRSSQEMMSGSCTTTTTRLRKPSLNRKWPMPLLHQPDLLWNPCIQGLWTVEASPSPCLWTRACLSLWR